MKLNITKKIGALEMDIKVDLSSEGIAAILGPSGAGKTSLLNMIAGFLLPDSGKIEFDKAVMFDSENKINIRPEKRNMGYVFQEHRLFPHYTVRGNLTYGVKRNAGDSRSEEFESIVQLLAIGDLLDRRPGKLSGGEKQRVAIGRALLSKPRMLLLDEPLASLDKHRKDVILGYLKSLNEQLKIPFLYVSHSPEEIRRLTDTVLTLDRGRLNA